MILPLSALPNSFYMASTAHVNSDRSTDIPQQEHKPILLRDPAYILRTMDTIGSDDNDNF